MLCKLLFVTLPYVVYVWLKIYDGLLGAHVLPHKALL